MMLQQKRALDHTSVIFLWCCVFVSCADVYLLKNENKLFKHLQPLGISPSPIAVSEESGSLLLCLAPFFKLAFVSRMFDSVYRCTVRYITDLSSLFDLFCKVQERKTCFFFLVINTGLGLVRAAGLLVVAPFLISSYSHSQLKLNI